jgi:hypothetical protein
MHARADEGAAAVDFTNSAAARLSCFGGLLKPTSLAVRKHSLTLTFPTLRSSPWVVAAANGNVSDLVS